MREHMLKLVRSFGWTSGDTSHRAMTTTPPLKTRSPHLTLALLLVLPLAACDGGVEVPTATPPGVTQPTGETVAPTEAQVTDPVATDPEATPTVEPETAEPSENETQGASPTLPATPTLPFLTPTPAESPTPPPGATDTPDITDEPPTDGQVTNDPGTPTPTVNSPTPTSSPTPATPCVDADGDHICADTDCNDNDAAVGPGKPEYCDGKDNDCDGSVDEDQGDKDNDGVTVCQGDCDDTNPAIKPGATEVCDGKDNNCEGESDEGFDQDGDGFYQCAQGPRAADCNDNNASMYPTATESCNGTDDDCDGTVDEGFDKDADGVTTCQGDCNDNNAAVSPDEVEICNTIDDNCSGVADEGFDKDGDGFYTCAQGPRAADCNDNNAAVYPNAVETCNTIDDNCNGQVDEGNDSDGDGYTLCGNPKDCNDNDATVKPGATEVCDGKDNNCDGVKDEGFDKDNDGVPACVVGTTPADCNDNNASVKPGAIELCNGIDENCNGTADEGFDKDNDSFYTCAVGTKPADCDDNSASIYPNATEVCDNKDNDCDGTTDEGLGGTYYPDADGDGTGATTGAVNTCSPASGYVTTTGDCNDNDASVAPNKTEVCDNKDNDCDGQKDEGLTSTFYPDADGDGVGSTSGATQACTASSGYVSSTGDCNDNDASVAPNKTEVCDAKDNDCDGATDEGLTATWYPDVDKDGVGATTGSTVTCSPPSGYVTTTGDCNDNDASVAPNKTEVCDNKDNDCDAAVDEGLLLTFYPDVDKDGVGATSGSTQACAAPSGYVSSTGDCNDNDATIKPGATEVCDGKDNNCNSQTDEGLLITYYPDVDRDGVGASAGATQACTAPSGYVTTTGDCNDNDATIKPGATEVCDGKDNNCNNQTDEGVKPTWYQDVDNDGYGNSNITQQACTKPTGYASQGGDCDDTSNLTNPAAVEQCDGKDNDCDGTYSDEPNLKTFYRDADNDGYGSSTTTTQACAAPSGYVAQSGDCNDNNATIKPGAAEFCNGADDDCDGSIDEGTLTTFYRDQDLDNYGVANTTTQACTKPSGYATASGDCDDSNPNTYPGAPEIIDGKDNNCDGQIEKTVSANAAVVTYTGTVVSGNLGASVDNLGDVDDDGFDDFGFGAKKWGLSESGVLTRTGGAFVVYGKGSGWSKVLDVDADTILTTDQADAELGTAITGGDLNGDGFADIMIGAPRYDSLSFSESGAVFILYGGARFADDVLTTSDPLAIYVQGYAPTVYLGTALDAQGDINGDNLDDLLIGAPWNWYSQAPPQGGALYIAPGKYGNYTGAGGIGAGELIQISGEQSQILGAEACHVGDVNGDTFGDFLGSGNGKYGSLASPVTNAGIVYILKGGTPDTLPTGTNLLAQDYDLATYTGDTSNDLVGKWAAGPGDITGDGRKDILIGRQTSKSSEALAMLFNGAATLPASGTAETKANTYFKSSSSSVTCPCSVGDLGDINSDGRPDFAIGVQNTTVGGTVYIFYGRSSAFPANVTVETDANLIVNGGAAGDQLGTAITSIGDINGDHKNDFALGATGVDVSGSADVGRVYVFFGF